MHSELVDTLRCLSVHEESWLVAAADETEGRHIMRGVLGCPVCHARYPIERGIADFSGGMRAPVALEDDDISVSESLELGAALGAVRPGGRVVATTAIDASEEVAVVARDAEHWVATRTSG